MFYRLFCLLKFLKLAETTVESVLCYRIEAIQTEPGYSPALCGHATMTTVTKISVMKRIVSVEKREYSTRIPRPESFFLTFRDLIHPSAHDQLVSLSDKIQKLHRDASEQIKRGSSIDNPFLEVRILRLGA